MQQLLKKIRRTLNDKKNRRQASRVVSSLCCVIVFATTYAMVLPAITMEQQALCGIEAHQHLDSCYELQPVCGMKESADHTHTDACYEKVLICGKEAHVHSVDCYTNASEEMLEEEVFTVAQDVEQVSAEGAMSAAEGSAETQTADTPAVASGDAQSAGADSADAQGTDTAFSDAQGTDSAFSDAQGTDAAAEGAQGAGGTSGDAQGASNSGTASPSSEETAEGTNSDPAGNSAAGDFDEFAPVQPGQADSATDINGNTGEYASEDKSGEAGATDAADTAEISAPAQDAEAGTEAAAEDSNMTEAQESAAISENMPALIFEDTILIQTATATAKTAEAETATDAQTGAENQTDAGISPARDLLLPAETNVTVHVEAEEGTFPAGTSMVLATVQDEALDKVAEAVSNSVEGTSHSFQAVDISFRDASGNEIEPAKPVRVTMTSDAIKTASETPEIAEPVVLHMVDEGAAEKIEQTDLMLASDAANSVAANESAAFENAETDDENLNVSPDTVSFDSDQFSTYVIVYTVDFHYEVDGKTYEFSLPGGGFVSFTDLVEVLGIIGDANSGENGAETDAAEVQAADGMLNVAASDEAKKFAADVASVAFSSPELVWIGWAEEETTVGALKEANGLECQYSSELTEEQINGINNTAVESGDWALISMLPFDTEETMTVTMKDGEVFTVKVTDAQISKTVIDAKGDTWEITVSYGDDAEIPDSAQLHVTEITEPDLYDEYMQRAAEVVEQESGNNNLLSGRFFDIQIKYGEDTVEPKAPVNVTIRYAEDVSLGKEDSMSAIHFAEDGIDLTEVNPEKIEEGGAEISFEQGSFSVTGTIITSGVISNGNYCILYKNGSNYYALRNDGNAVQVSVDKNGTVKPVSGEDLPASLIWTRTGQVWRGSQNTGRYLRPTDNSATDTGSANLTITSTDDSDGSEVYRFYRTEQTWNGRRYVNTTYYLRFSNNNFTGGTSNSNNQFYLARIESDTNVKIHYGYLDDSGNYVEWTDRQKTLRNPNMLGDQYDVRVDIDGYEYVTTRLKTSEGRDIINLLQTEQDKEDGGNTPISSDNNKTAVWRFRAATQDNAIYPEWKGIAYDYRLSENILGDQDIYVVYRQNKKSSSSSGGSDLGDIDAPHISKEKQDNGDGTYDIDLSVTAEAETSSHSGKANVVIVLDTSGSMNEKASSGETKWSLVTSSVKSLATDLLGLNTGTGDDAKRVEFALVNFSNYVKNENWIYSVGSDNKNHHFFTNSGSFNREIDNLQVQGGTCWDKALAAANSVLWDDNDPVYVVFVSDGDTNSRAYANGNYDLWDGGTYVDNTYSTDYENNANAKYNVDSATNFADKIREKGGTIYTVGITGGGNLVNLYRLTHGTETDHPYHYDVTDSEGIEAAFTSIKNNILSTLGYQNIVVTDGLTGMTQTALVNGNAGNFSYTVAKYTTSTEKLAELPTGASLGSKKDAAGNITSYTRNTGTDSTDFPYIKTVKTVVSGSKATVAKNNNGKLTITFPDGTSDTVDQASYAAGTKTVTWNFGDTYQLRDGYTYTVSFTVWPNQASYDLLAALRNGLLEWGNDFTYTDESGKQQTIKFEDYNGQIDKSGDDYALRSNVESGNTVTYYKVATETLTRLPDGAEVGSTTDPVTKVITTYTGNDNGTYTKTVKTPGTLDFVNPEPMPLAGTKLAMTKVWNDTLDRGHLEKLIADAEKAGKTYSVTLVVSQNGTEYKRYTFEPVKKYYTDEDMTTEAAEGVTTAYYKYIWPSQDVSIAPALLVSDPPEGYAEKGYKTVTLNNETYYVLNEGHSYTIDETVTDYHFEFIADPYHPSLIDSASKLSNVDFETDENGAIEDKSTANISGSGNLESFTANNSLTAELDITKKISDPKNLLTDAQEDAETFTYKVTLTVPKDTEANHLYAYEFVPRSDPWNGSNRVYAYGYQDNDDDSVKGLEDDVARFNKQVFGRYTISYPSEINTLADLFTDDGNGTTKTGTIFITLKRNEIIRFTNLPLGTEYKIQEIYANLRQADPSRDADSTPAANTEASNIAQQGYSVSVLTKNGDPSVSTTAVAQDTVSGTITELDTRYYNQFTNTLNDATVVNLAVTKHLQGYQWSGERYYVKLTGDQIINRFTDTERYLTRASGSEDVTYTYASPLRFEKEGEYTLTFTEHDSAFKDILSGTTTGGIQYGPAVTVKIKVEKVNGKLTVANVQGGTLSEDKSLITATVTNSKGVGLQLLKLGDGSFSKPLEGVQFKLYTDQDCADEHQVVADLTGAPVGTDGVITTSSDDSDNGMAYLGSLGGGTYYLKEITGHVGYNLLSELITITIGTDGRVTYSQSSYTDSGKGPDLVYKDKDGKFYYYSQIRNDESDVYKDDDAYTFAGYRIIVSNQSGVELPATGGPGTTLLHLLGIMLTGLAGAGLVMKRLRRNMA